MATSSFVEMVYEIIYLEGVLMFVTFDPRWFYSQMASINSRQPMEIPEPELSPSYDREMRV